MWRRRRRSASLSRLAISSPSKRTEPAVGSIRRSTSRPVVDLPQPDSPTSASVSPRRDLEADVLDRAHQADQPCGGPARGVTGKCLTRPSTCRTRQRRSCARSTTRLDRRLPAGRPGGPAPTSRSGGGSWRGSGWSANGQRGAKRQPAGWWSALGHRALDGRQPLAVDVEPRDRAQQADRVGMLRIGEQRRRPARSRRSCRRTSPRTSSATSAMTPRSWVMIRIAMPSRRCRSLQQVEDLRLDGDVERGGRLVGDQQRAARRRAPWRSSRAGACRPTGGAGSRRSAAAAEGMRTSSSISMARVLRRLRREPGVGQDAPRRSAGRSCGPG